MLEELDDNKSRKQLHVSQSNQENNCLHIPGSQTNQENNCFHIPRITNKSRKCHEIPCSVLNEAVLSARLAHNQENVRLCVQLWRNGYICQNYIIGISSELYESEKM